MFNPAEFFALIEFDNEIQIEVKVVDHQNREIWGEVPDSFTPEDMEAIGQMFLNHARMLRDNI